jgi:hypothetical protein
MMLSSHLQYALADFIIDGITRCVASQRGVVRGCGKQCSKQAVQQQSMPSVLQDVFLLS